VDEVGSSGLSSPEQTRGGANLWITVDIPRGRKWAIRWENALSSTIHSTYYYYCLSQQDPDHN